MIAVPQVSSEGMEVIPVARDELVYVSADPERLRSPVTAAQLAQASLVMPETTWRAVDSTRIVLRRMFFFSSRRRHTRFDCDWSSDVCSSDLGANAIALGRHAARGFCSRIRDRRCVRRGAAIVRAAWCFRRAAFRPQGRLAPGPAEDRKSVV